MQAVKESRRPSLILVSGVVTKNLDIFGKNCVKRTLGMKKIITVKVNPTTSIFRKCRKLI